MICNFYDIECLRNVFTLCNYKPKTENTEEMADLYYLIDNENEIINVDNFEELVNNICRQENPNFKGKVNLYNLKKQETNERLAETFGLSSNINDKTSESLYPKKFRLVCDTDEEYQQNPDKYPFLMGYNSYNYDTTMLSLYLYEVFSIKEDYNNNIFCEFTPTTAQSMRLYNDKLFEPNFKSNMPIYLACMATSYDEPNYNAIPHSIRKNMLMSGRHIDVARLNEKQQYVALKRLVGMLGGQIKESDKLKNKTNINNLDELLDLIAYNLSDCVNLKKYIFDNKEYAGQFELKRQLLKTYPELVYKKKENEYKPDMQNVRPDRLFIDSSSAQLATKTLCPYGRLKDIRTVSFMYPSAEKAKELNIPQVNVLEETKKFFYKNFKQPHVRKEFDRIYNYYKNIEGKNFNNSTNDYGMENINDKIPLSDIRELSKENTCICYYDKDGNETSCFVTFSIGGIHGAEYNKKLYDNDLTEYQNELKLFNAVKEKYPDAVDLRKAKNVTINIDNNIVEYPYTKFLKSGATMKKAEYKTLKPVELFKLKKDGKSTKLNPKYTYTSCGLTNHEDFTSYYPNLLRMLMAFYNKGLGYDRYAEIFQQKEDYGKLMKDKSLSSEQKELYSILRNGTKLILNSASGAADANFESNIRMNNMIISMRIIGQLFTWRIGQAQAIAGANVISTNTDGLFTILQKDINDRILERESNDINVEIVPEPIALISKDSNNRVEFDNENGDIERASGGTLACRKGPNPTKSLDHPAIIDWALTEYLISAATNYRGASLFKDMDMTLGKDILESAKKSFDKVKFLNMFQNLVASSPSSNSYVYGYTDDDNTPIILQHYNRMFIMKDKTPNTIHIKAATLRKITPAQKLKRQTNNEMSQQHDKTALQIIEQNSGIKETDITFDYEAANKKITNIDESWYIYVQNKDLNYLPESELDFIIDNLDYEKYLQLLKDCYENNWQNQTVEEITQLIYSCKVV